MEMQSIASERYFGIVDSNLSNTIAAAK